MIPQEHMEEAARQREERRLTRKRKVTAEEAARKREWLRRMQAQAQSLIGSHELWNELSQVLPCQQVPQWLTGSEFAMYRLGQDSVIRIVEKHARWREEAPDAEAG